MKTSNFWGMTRSSGGKTGMIVRIGLASLAVIGSLLLAWSILSTQSGVHAAAPVATPTTKNPWGIAFDKSGHVWVAEPGCNALPGCGTKFVGIIGEYNVATNTFVKDFTEPAGYTSPVFIATDTNGNIWFTEPTSDSIGELSAAGTWQQWAVTGGSGPFDLTFDSNGNIWYTEFSANKIGFFDTKAHKHTDYATPTAGSKPYGITLAPNKDIWFTENGLAKLGSFTPTATGVLAAAAIKEHAITNPGPHLITSDSAGNIWYSEGFTGNIGEYSTAGVNTDIPVETGICPPATPGTTPPACSGTHISGIAVDASNNVWFTDSLSNRIGYYSTTSKAYTAQAVVDTGSANPHTNDGLAIDSSGNVWFTEQNGFKLDKAVAGTITPGSPTTGSPTPPPTTPPGPVAKTWYFAEGRVGSGFREYLTIDNPTTIACTANIKYLYTVDGSTTPSAKTVTVPVSAASRATQPVNIDLGISDSTTPAASVAAVVTVDATTPSCTGFVVERPVYFTNYHGLSSGTDVLGSTTLGTAFNFADVPSGAGFNSYLTILNPGAATANITVKYYANGQAVGTQTLAVPTATRGTIAPAALTPALPVHSAAVVTSAQPVLVERPTYISNVNGFSGAADVVGSQVLAKDWLFAEGYAAATSQESRTLANVNTKPATVTITLKSKTGATNPVNVTVPALSQLVWSVNANNNFTGASPEVSAEVLSTGVAAISIVVQREMYYQYGHTLSNGRLQTNSVTDVLGMVAVNARSSYSFSEGYTNTNYHEWLTLQNSTANAETIYVTLVNGLGKSFTQAVSVVANSRSTVDITLLVQQNLAQPGDIAGNEISMTAQTLNNGGVFVAERPLYFNTTGSPFVTLGGTDIIGY